MRHKLPTDRTGQVHKLKLGAASLYVVVNLDENRNPRECFGYGDDGVKAELDGLCGLVSIALQHDTPLERIVRFLAFRRYPPHGGPGQPVSVSDALARVLREYIKQEGE